MATNLEPIKTIIIVMMENRSFDHVLGYLSLPPYNKPGIDGQGVDPKWIARFTNLDDGKPIQPFLNDNPYDLADDFDPPHERPNVSDHLGTFDAGEYAMNGFVKAIPNSVSSEAAVRRLVMGYFGAQEVPINHFFAQHFAVCNRWFCSLPAGTQPNRLMAMSGFSNIEVNTTPLPEQSLVYDWLNEHNVSWRVYHQGIPFFALMPRWIGQMLWNRAHFRSFENIESDLTGTPPNQQARVIFVEPSYQDAPHLSFSTDDHAPAGVSNGQEFLMQVYNAVTASPAFWKSALLIVTYDEHGGFFDHVSPPLIPTDPPRPGAYPRFESLGVRVPAFIISPFVQPGSVNNGLFDHTSILKLLGEKFGTGGSYSALVDARPVQNLSEALDIQNPSLDRPAPPALNSYLDKRPKPPDVTVPTPRTALQSGFSNAVANMRAQGAGSNHETLGKLFAQLDSEGH